MQLNPSSQQPIIIDSNTDSLPVYLKKIWRYRQLILTFARRDLKVKFAQTSLGLAWVIIQPTFAVAVYTAFFTLVIKIPTGNTPYILFVISGITLWGLFSYIFSQGVNVLISNQDLIRKMAFPKITLPFSKVIVAGIEFVISFILLFIAWLILSRNIQWQITLLLLPILGVALFALAITLILLSYSIKNRDLLHIAPFLVYFGIWFTPVFYPVSLIPEEVKHLIYLNPLAGMIDFFRWTIGINPAFSIFYLIDFLGIVLLFALALIRFKNIEDNLVDTI